MERTEKSIEVNAPVGVVFGLYSDFERFPEWMKHIKEVRRTEENHTHWTANAPLGMSVEWEAETTALEPNRKIAWRTVQGDLEMEGEVTFEEIDSARTRMHVSIGYDPPAGALGALVAKLFGNDPSHEIDEEMRRFAELAERQAAENQQSEHAEENADSANRQAA